jgi:hypothetical protein
MNNFKNNITMDKPVIQTLTDLSTFDPMLKDVVVSNARRDFQFYGKKDQFQEPINEVTKRKIHSDYSGFNLNY